MASDALTDYDFWKNYWLSKEGLIFPIPNQYTFTKELARLIESKKIKTLLEIGGFPGYYSVWAGKKFDIKSTLLDFVILDELVDQRTFDPENYAKHHIPCMDIDLLTTICQNLNLKNVDVNYSCGFMLWLENESTQPLWVKAFKKACWLPLKIFFKLVPIQTKAFAPYILIKAEK